jgi:hypothetical protein
MRRPGYPLRGARRSGPKLGAGTPRSEPVPVASIIAGSNGANPQLIHHPAIRRGAATTTMPNVLR